MTKHILKTWPEFFQNVKSGHKTFEMRFNDRNYQVGDTLILKEFEPFDEKYSGEQIEKKVTYILGEPYAPDNYVVMALEDVNSKITYALNSYQHDALRTAGMETQAVKFSNFGLGLSGEAGEVTDYLKKVLYHGHKLDKSILCKELGDVLWYVATLADTAGLTLEDVARVNIEKLRARYPDGFSKERSVNREESQ